MENYTKIENKVLEKLIFMNLSVSALKCALFLLRKLNGFNKEEDMISNSQMSNAINKSTRSIINGMKELQLVNIVALVKQGSSAKNCNIWRFNKDSSSWLLVNEDSLVKKPALVKICTETSENLGNQLVKKSAHTKETITKEIIQKKGELTPSKKCRLFFNNPDKRKELVILYSRDKNINSEQLIGEIEKFVSYWTELNKTGTKQRWEMEKTFEINRRLGNWFRNAKGFSNKTDQINDIYKNLKI